MNKNEPRILIGLDNLHLIVPLEIRYDSRQGLVGARTKLGWTLYGPESDSSAEEQTTDLMHVVNTTVAESKEMNSDIELHDIVKEFLFRESFGSDEAKVTQISSEEEQAIEIFDEKILETVAAVHCELRAGELVDFDRYSSWTRLSRVCAYVQKFVDLCRKKHPRTNSRELTSEEWEMGEKLAVRLAQEREFSREISALKNGMPSERLNIQLTVEVEIGLKFFIRQNTLTTSKSFYLHLYIKLVAWTQGSFSE